MSAESRSEPGTMTDASDCEPVRVDEEPTSFLFDYSLPAGDQICDQTSAENSPSDAQARVKLLRREGVM